MQELEKKFRDLLNKFEEKIIFDKDIKNKLLYLLFEEMEQIFLSKYKLNKLNNISEIEKNIINKFKMLLIMRKIKLIRK